MIIEWKDPNMKLHGKRHKSDRYYFRVHYGKQRLVHLYKEYVDKPTEAQKTAREEFTEMRREVARQLKDPVLRAKWERKFEADNQGYKMLHCYVYAMLKRSATEAINTSSEGAHADFADNANFASWAQNNADGTRRLVKDNAERSQSSWQKGLHVVVIGQMGEMRLYVMTHKARQAIGMVT